MGGFFNLGGTLNLRHLAGCACFVSPRYYCVMWLNGRSVTHLLHQKYFVKIANCCPHVCCNLHKKTLLPLFMEINVTAKDRNNFMGKLNRLWPGGSGFWIERPCDFDGSSAIWDGRLASGNVRGTTVEADGKGPASVTNLKPRFEIGFCIYVKRKVEWSWVSGPLETIFPFS